MRFVPADGGETKTWKVFDFKDEGGIGMGMYNTTQVRTGGTILTHVQSNFINFIIAVDQGLCPQQFRVRIGQKNAVVFQQQEHNSQSIRRTLQRYFPRDVRQVSGKTNSCKVMSCLFGLTRVILIREYKPRFEAARISYEHRLIDDMVAQVRPLIYLTVRTFTKSDLIRRSVHEKQRWLCVGVQELRRRRAVRHSRAGLRFVGHDDE